LAVESLPLAKTKREFSVMGAYLYDRSSPLRWIISHLWRYKLYLVGFFFMSVLVNTLFSAVPRLTGLAFDTVLQPDASSERLLTIALIILGIVLVRGVVDLANSFTIETLFT
jgi:ATP-binding cassette, subfamily B, bacterial